MGLFEGIPGWVIAVVVAVIILGTIVGILVTESRKQRNDDSSDSS